MKHFRGYLGNSYLISDFDYDENVFEIKNSDELFDVDFPVKHEKVLHYIGKDDNCVVDLPSGCYSTCGMFYWEMALNWVSSIHLVWMICLTCMPTLLFQMVSY